MLPLARHGTSPRGLAYRPWLATGFLIAIVSVQAAALARQFQRGFRPLRVTPTRVPLSWDMFSVRIERCGIEWTPALPLRPGKAYPSLRSMAPRLEWDPVYDTAADYFAAAGFGCRMRHAPTRVRMRCMTRYGISDYAFDCP
jgi:hypothetical protein